MILRLPIVALVAASLSNSGCKTAAARRANSVSATESLAADEKDSTLNQVIAFGSPGSGEDFLPAVKIDMDSVEAPFSHRRVGFKVKTFYDMDYDSLITSTEQYAKDVAESGTLVWIFSGHGYDAGELMVGREVLKFSHIAKAIRRARGDKPLRRLVVIVDSCYSGNLIEGEKPVTGFGLTGVNLADPAAVNGALNQELLSAAISEFGPLTGSSASGVQLTGMLFQEVIVLTSARKTQTSNSHSTKGSQMMRALVAAVNEVTSGGSNYSIAVFLDRVKAVTSLLNGEKGEDGKTLTPQTALSQFLPPSVGTEAFASSRP